MSDTEDRLDRLESQLEQQQETIEKQRERVAELENDPDDDEERTEPESMPKVSRRGALTAGGLLALLFGGVGTASADAQGKVGTSSDPLDGLYTDDLHGNSGTITVRDALDLLNSDSIKDAGTDAITFDGNQNVAIPNGNLDLNGNNLTDNSGGLTIQASSGNSITINTDGSNRSLKLGVPSSDGNNIAGGNFVAGHPNNAVNNGAVGAVIGGGGNDDADPSNVVKDDYGTIGGGIANQAGDDDSNPGSAARATVGGGSNNTAKHFAATVGGGNGNTASAINATVSGGGANTASGIDAIVAGGNSNTADGQYSFAAGHDADTGGHDGAFVFGDSSDTTVTAGSADQVVFQAGGTRTSGTAVEFYSQSDGSAGVKLAANDGTWQSLSSRAAKTDIDRITGPDVLDTVEQLEISTWRYEGQDESVRHMGPMAEEFHDAFGLGTDEETIAALDTAGVALAAIQGLAQRLDEKNGRIDDLEAETESLRAEKDRLRERNNKLESRLDRIEAHLGIDETGRQGVADD